MFVFYYFQYNLLSFILKLILKFAYELNSLIKKVHILFRKRIGKLNIKQISIAELNRKLNIGNDEKYGSSFQILKQKMLFKD